MQIKEESMSAQFNNKEIEYKKPGLFFTENIIECSLLRINKLKKIV